MYPFLLTSDLHLTDKVEDEYRWTIFDRLHEAARRSRAKAVVITGDVTDAKDRHSATLTNRVVDCMSRLAATVGDVTILLGNHDYLLEGTPFFEFLRYVPNVHFVTEPTKIMNFVFIPHSRKLPLPGLELVDEDTEICFLHQTVTGAVTSNGTAMEGELDGRKFPHLKTCKYISGDIHVPQVIGKVEYVGSPYPVHFGDTYNAQFLTVFSPVEIERHRWQGLRRESVRVSSPRDIERLELRKGDQVKVVLCLEAHQVAHWQDIKREVEAQVAATGAQLVSLRLEMPRVARQQTSTRVRLVEGSSALARYAADRGVDPLTYEVGERLVRSGK